jgi:hypothetical protein
MKTRTYLFEAGCCALFLAFGVTGARSQAQTPPTEGGQLSETLRTVAYPEAIYPDGIVPDWDRGYVIHYEIEMNHSPDAPMIVMYDATGKRIRQGRIWPQGASSVSIRRTAASREGAILAAGAATMQDRSFQRYIVKTDLAGNTVQTLRTGSFGAEQMCEAPDGTIWTLGRDVKDGEVQRESEVLRQYSFAKGLLHSYLPQVSVEAVVPPRSKTPWFVPFGSYVRCGKDKVSVYLEFTDEYVEVDTSTFELKRWKLDMTAVPHEKASGLAVTEDGRVYASFEPSWMDGHENIRGLYQVKAEPENPVARLLPVAGTISVLERGKKPPPGTIILLWGADGNQLVLWRAGEPDVSWVDVIHN